MFAGKRKINSEFWLIRSAECRIYSSAEYFDRTPKTPKGSCCWPPIYFVVPSASLASIGLPAPKLCSTNPTAPNKTTMLPSPGRNTRRLRVHRPCPHPDPRAPKTQHPLLRHLLIESAGVSSQDQPCSIHIHKRRLFPKTNRPHPLPTKASRTEETMGSSDPTRLPYGPSYLPRLRRRTTRHCFHHRAESHCKDLAPLAESKQRFSRSPYSRISTYFGFLLN